MEDEAAGLERYRGYCAAVRAMGLSQLEQNVETSAFSMEDGAKAAKRLWLRTGGLDGIVCASDKIAIGAMRYLRQEGLRIPDDVMISGHGDSGYSQVTSPTLSTVHYAFKEAGKLAAQMIVGMLEKNASTLEGMMLGYRVLDRESTGGSGE
jgi:DNA-binding LacI/PurR family transcriptional regulator